MRLLLGAGAASEAASTVRHDGVSHRGATGTAGAKILVGLAVIVLGILALVGIQPAVMLLVAVLILGGILMLSGVAMSSRFMSAHARLMRLAAEEGMRLSRSSPSGHPEGAREFLWPPQGAAAPVCRTSFVGGPYSHRCRAPAKHVGSAFST